LLFLIFFLIFSSIGGSNPDGDGHKFEELTSDSEEENEANYFNFNFIFFFLFQMPILDHQMDEIAAKKDQYGGQNELVENEAAKLNEENPMLMNANSNDGNEKWV
jgi:hypothetical protein